MEAGGNLSWVGRIAGYATFALFVLAAACGGASPGPGPGPAPAPSPPSAPSPTPPAPQPEPTPPVGVSITGTWTGNIESSNAQTRSILMTLGDKAGCVDGGFSSTGSEWTGIVSGNSTGTSFEGTVNLNYRQGGQNCSGNATFAGPVAAEAITWTSPGFTGACAGMPSNVTIRLERR